MVDVETCDAITCGSLRSWSLTHIHHGHALESNSYRNERHWPLIPKHSDENGGAVRTTFSVPRPAGVWPNGVVPLEWSKTARNVHDDSSE
jgi:hypothetical protein